MPSFRLALFGLLAIVWLPTALAADLPASEQQRVAFLIESVARLRGAVFIRNGTEHPAADAAEHLTMKLRRAKNSWFAPPAESWTAELFIDKLASRSSISGKPYQIRFADGSLVNAGDWLRQQLARYDAGASSD